MKEQIIALAKKFQDVDSAGKYEKELRVIDVHVHGIFEIMGVRMGNVEVVFEGKHDPVVKLFSNADFDPEYLNAFIEEYLNKFHDFVSVMPSIDISQRLKEIESQELKLKSEKEKLLSLV